MTIFYDVLFIVMFVRNTYMILIASVIDQHFFLTHLYAVLMNYSLSHFFYLLKISLKYDSFVKFIIFFKVQLHCLI